VRSYAYALLRWWRFLRVVDVEWDKATSAEVRDFVLWLGHATKPVAARRKGSAALAGTINPVTRKQYLSDEYGSRTIRHSNSVLRTFYEYWIDEGAGPLANPVPLARSKARANAHHNPLEPFSRSQGRLRYNPKVPKRRPRSMPDDRWADLFAAMCSNRDRAILALAISTGARASELVRMRVADVDWGEQLIRVRRKGTDAEQWLPASPDAFVWLRLYVAEIPRLAGADWLWWTLRRRHGDGRPRRVPLDYDALRAVLRRANTLLSTNWTTANGDDKRSFVDSDSQVRVPPSRTGVGSAARSEPCGSAAAGAARRPPTSTMTERTFLIIAGNCPSSDGEYQCLDARGVMKRRSTGRHVVATYDRRKPPLEGVANVAMVYPSVLIPYPTPLFERTFHLPPWRQIVHHLPPVVRAA
jgi:integrase